MPGPQLKCRYWGSMETHRERILRYLRTQPAGVDDDSLAKALQISERQTVNKICRTLRDKRLVVREYDPVVGKIVNRLIDHSIDQAHTPPPLPSTTATVTITGRACLVPLNGKEAVLGFAYSGELELTEDQVKAAVTAVLQAAGWSVDVRWGHAPGIDIEARRGAERLMLEAKGEGSRSAMRVNYFLGALGELLQRMDSPDAVYGLVLPAHRQFVRLVLRLPDWVKARLDLRFFLVRPTPSGEYEIGSIGSSGELLPALNAEH